MTDESRAGSSLLPRLMLPLVLVLTFVTYSGTLRYEFVYDDGDFIVRNRYLTSWTYFPRYFTEHLWSHRDYNLPGNYYRPLFLVWAMINRSLLGLNSTAWHLMTLLMYLAVVVMVYWLVRRLLKDRITASIAAGIFGLYPLHIETAAWVCGASETVLAMLLLPAFVFYINSRDGELKGAVHRPTRFKWAVLSLVMYTAALFAKETAIILPAILVAWELICGRGSQLSGQSAESDSAASRFKSFVASAINSLKPVIPYAVIGLAYLVIRTLVLGNLMFQPNNLRLLTKLLTIPSLLWGYLRLLLWPVGLSEFYDTPYIERPEFVRFVLPLCAVIFAVVALVWMIRRVKDRSERRLLFFACAWIVIPILPVLNIGTFRKGDLIHDRYLFLPTIGVALLVAYGLRKLRDGSAEVSGLPRIQALVALILAGALGIATAYQHVHWANDIVLFHHSLAVAPGNEVAQGAFGDALSKREMYDEAIVVFADMIQSSPENPTGHYNLGYNYYKVGRYREALPHLITAIDINPTDPRHYLTLGVTLFYLDKYEVAERVLRDAISMRPHETGLHYALGAVLKQTGRLQEALDEFKQEVVYNPEYVSAYDQINSIQKLMDDGASESRRN